MDSAAAFSSSIAPRCPPHLPTLASFVVCFLLTVCLPSFAAAGPRDITACWAAHSGLTPAVSASHFIVTSAATRAMFPGYTIHAKVLGKANKRGLAYGIAEPLFAEGRDCTLLLGPGWSSVALQLEPIVNGPLWVGWSPTSTELTSKVHFNRVIPTDIAAAPGVLRFLEAQRWPLVNALCADTGYGRSFVQGLVDAAEASAGAVTFDRSRCFPTSATAEAVEGYLLSLLQSRSRVVVAILEGDLYATVVDAVLRLGLRREFIFFFGEYSCSSDNDLWLKLPGSFCLSYATNRTMISAFEAEYWQRTTLEAMEPTWVRVGDSGSALPTQFRNTTTLDSFAIDATRFSLTALRNYMDRYPNRTMPIVEEDIITVAREGNTRLRGVTGEISLDKHGDRPAADIAIHNTYIDAGSGAYTERVVMSIDTASAVAVTATPFYPAEGFSGSPATYLSAVGLAGDPAEDRTVLFVAIGVLAATLLLVGGAVALYIGLRIRRLRRYPTDPTQPFTALFVSVKNDAEIRDRYGLDVAHAAFRRLEAMVDKAAQHHGGVVVRRLGAHFMVIAHHPRAALMVATDVMAAHDAEPWRNRLSLAAEAEPRPGRRLGASANSASASPPTGSSSRARDQQSPHSSSASGVSGVPLALVLKSPSISIGIAHGVGRIDHGDDAFDIRYAGTVVDTAAALTDAAQPLQILLTSEAIATLPEDAVAELDVEEAWTQTLPGCAAPVTAHFLVTTGTVSPQLMSTIDTRTADEVINVGGVTAALEAAAGGLSVRCVAVAVLHIPALQGRAGFVDAHDVGDVITSAAAEEKGCVVAACDDCIVVAVNAVGPPVSQATLRAATIALNAVGALTAKDIHVTAAVDTAAAAVGTIGDSQTVTCTTAVRRATALAVLATRAHPGVAAVAHHAPNPAVVNPGGAAEAPAEPPTSSTGTVPSGMASESSTPTVVLATSWCFAELSMNLLVRGADLVAFPAPKSTPKASLVLELHWPDGDMAGPADDEWMYQLSSAEEHNPAASTAALRALCESDFQRAAASAQGSPSAAALLRTVVACPGEAAADKVLHYAKGRMNLGTVAYPTTD